MLAVERVLDKRLRPLGELLPSVRLPSLHNLLWKDVFVAVESSNTNLLLLDVVDDNRGGMSQSDLVDMLVSSAFDRHKPDEHVFLLGHKQGESFETKNSHGKYGVRFPNWMVSYLKTPAWSTLLEAIGVQAMTRLLRSHHLFVKQNKCFIQLTGRVFHKLVSSHGRQPKLLPLAMKLGKFITPKRAVSREQARALALSIIRQTQRRQPQQQQNKRAVASSHRTRLDRSWINAMPLLQRLLENHRKRPHNFLFARAMSAAAGAASNQTPADTEDLLESLRQRDVPLAVVSVYLKSVLLRIVPKPFWGTARTRRKLLSKLHHMWVLSPHPTASSSSSAAAALSCELAEVSNLELSSFSWLEGKRKRQCYQQFIRFLFTFLARDIVKSRFLQLVSPQLKVAYHLHTGYEAHVVGEYLDDNPLQFEPAPTTVPVQQRMKARGFGAIHPRFGLKKSHDRFRLILNMRRVSKEFPVAANVHFRPAFHALTYEMDLKPELGGSFVQGMHLVHRKYVDFFRRRRTSGGGGAAAAAPPLYCVVVDVEKCYDTMRPDLVYSLVQQTLQCREYAISTKSITFLDQGLRTVRTKHVKIVHEEQDDRTNLLQDQKFSSAHSAAACVAVDGINRQYITRDRALALVSELLYHTYVDFGKQAGVRRMIQGVPQGCILSTLLCRLYYGRFELETLQEFTLCNDNLLMRYVDDFIFFTPSLQVAEQFKRKMELGNAKFNCYINANKVDTSWSSTSTGSASTARWLPWCSLLFHTRTGEVRAHYQGRDSAYPGSKVAARGLGPTLRSTVRTKCHALLLDLEINSLHNVFCNLAQLLVLCATRFVKYVKHGRRRRSNGGGGVGWWREIGDLFAFVHTMVHSRTPSAGDGQQNSSCLVSLQDVECLGVMAFYLKVRRDGVEAAFLASKYEASLSLRRTIIGQRHHQPHRIHWARVERAASAVANFL